MSVEAAHGTKSLSLKTAAGHELSFEANEFLRNMENAGVESKGSGGRKKVSLCTVEGNTFLLSTENAVFFESRLRTWEQKG